MESLGRKVSTPRADDAAEPGGAGSRGAGGEPGLPFPPAPPEVPRGALATVRPNLPFENPSPYVRKNGSKLVGRGGANPAGSSTT